ncbi:alpha/beta hydrolase [Alcanivorax marinus]|uniref:Alpha/beta hydrolase n=1 Tax=Alloalcanivorax marinus TaxID=1177169 RepID=A0A9Q3UQ97_9GAMM|nr:alpha/beta hydrolase [Alloalcanivorax marinus]MCC4310430.1 alpha/beta hydrolase [Alloalcanivorax marinus]MCU5785571.1 alpha/beta hydrolase fold protein [Alloalcanivorax marinus]
MLRQHIIKLGPVRTRYFEVGDVSAPTVVLIHEGGFGGDALNTFEAVAELLSDEYRVVLPDMLGFGGTDKAVFFGENPYAPRLRHLSCFFDALDIREAHVVGNSFGGGMTLRLSMLPETSWRMLSATSISGTGGPFRLPEALADMAGYHPSIDAAAKLDTWVLPEGVALPEHARARFESSMIPGQWEALMAMSLRNPAMAEKAGNWDLPEALSASTVRTLLIAGSGDRMLEAGWHEKTAAHIPVVETHVMEGAGHSPNIDQPQAVVDILREWFSRS